MRADTALISLCITLIILIIFSQRIYIKIKSGDKAIVCLGFTLLEYSFVINKSPKFCVVGKGNIKAFLKSLKLLRRDIRVSLGLSREEGFYLLCECTLYRLIIFSLSVLYYKIIGSIKKGIKNV